MGKTPQIPGNGDSEFRWPPPEAHIPTGRVVRHAPKLEVDGNRDMAVNKRGERFWREGTRLRPIKANLQYVPKKLYPLSVHKTWHGFFQVRYSGNISCTRHDIKESYHRLIGDVLPTAGDLQFLDK